MFEYVIVVGVVVVALAAGMYGVNYVIEVLLGHACESIDTAKGISATVGSCIG